jgi:prepilin-type N-terminal cleavage/methylation domain-containing protein
MKKGFTLKRYANEGFTLIELLVVIGVMAVIAAGVIATINPAQKLAQARDAQIQSAVGQVAGALQAAAAVSTTGFYPAALADLTTAASAELTSLPALPTGCTVGSCVYTYTGGGTAAVSLSVPMQATRNITSGVLWCWRSATGAVGFAGACAP